MDAGLVADRLAVLGALSQVGEGVERARVACTALRWHQALRRRAAEAAAESRVRGAAASARLDGAHERRGGGLVDLARILATGRRGWQSPADPVERVVRAAVRVTSATSGPDVAVLRSPAQLLARLHLAAAGDLLPPAQVGRPRRPGETCAELSGLGPPPDGSALRDRLEGLEALLIAAAAGAQPVLLLGAVVHAEVAVTRPFAGGNALVARALERLVLRIGGVDPTGVAVPEVGHARDDGAAYRDALAGYAHDGPDGVRDWLVHTAEAVTIGAAEGTRVADAVLSGTLEARVPLAKSAPEE